MKIRAFLRFESIDFIELYVYKLRFVMVYFLCI